MKKIDVKGIAIKAAATGGGAIAAAKISSLPVLANMKPVIKGIINVALGAILPKYLGKGKKGAIAEDIGSGMMAVGSLQLANQTIFKSNPVSVQGVGELATLGSDYDQIVAGFPTMGEPETTNLYE